MGDSVQDTTYVIVDNTPPILVPTNQSIPANERAKLQKNIESELYDHTSR